MKIFFFSLSLFVLAHSMASMAQSWQWAYTMGTTPRSQTAAVKQDHNGNFYVAGFTDSIATPVSTQLEKRDANQLILWQKQIDGDATITDIEINAANHVVVAGYFLGMITIDGNDLTSFSPSDGSGFIFEADETGVVQWAHDLNPINGDFKTNDLFIGADGSMYLTSQVSGNFGFCAFHKLDAQGNIVKSEFNNNFEDRTFSHVLADSSGNVYLSGTCGNGGVFDTINANPGFSYQNFLMKYDSTFKAQWFISHNYVTFDDNNSLSTDGQNLYWAFNDFTSNMDTVRIVKCDRNGQVLNSINGPLDNVFFPAITYAADQGGHSVLVLNIYSALFFYHYDNAFNITWQDTLHTSASGFPFYHGLTCYDSSFYFSSCYLSDTLVLDNFTLINPNAGTLYPSDIFVAKWGSQLPDAISTVEESKNSVVVFPNPVDDELNIESSALKGGETIRIFDAIGNAVYSGEIKTSSFKLQASHFHKGIYFIQVMNQERVVTAYTKFVVM